MRRKTTPPKVRFIRFYVVDRSTGCWVWTGSTNGKYPVFPLSRREKVYAHRFSYETFVAPIPRGLEIDHQCNNKLCVNPDHLKPMTHQENYRRWSETITHCCRGHPFDEANTWVEKNGHRHCRECHRQIQGERQRRQRAASRAAKQGIS